MTPIGIPIGDEPVFFSTAPAIPHGLADPRVSNGSSAIEVARDGPGHTFAAFRACVIETGEPFSEHRRYILTNRSRQTISTSIDVLESDSVHWVVHTVRRVTLDPGESFDVYITFLPKETGLQTINLQINSFAGGSLLERPIVTFNGRGFDCQEEELIPEPVEEHEGVPLPKVPDFLKPETGTSGSGEGSTTTDLPESEQAPPEPDPASPGATIIRPEDLLTPEQLSECPGLFTEAVDGWNYRARLPRPLRRVQPAIVHRQPARYTGLPVRRATINYVTVKSFLTTPPPAQSLPWSESQVNEEIRNTIRWYANYCIFLTFREIRLDGATANGIADDYDDWLASLPPRVTSTVRGPQAVAGEELLQKIIAATKAEIPNANELTVLFLDRFVGLLGARYTQSSFAIIRDRFFGVGLHGADRDDRYILSHELIHTFGLNANTTWYHNSSDVRSMSKIGREVGGLASPANLSGSRLLDFAEYATILRARVVR